MIRAVFFGLVLGVLAGLSPYAFAQPRTDSTYSSLRRDSVILLTPRVPNGAHLSFDHVLSIYEWSGRFFDTSLLGNYPAVRLEPTDTVQLTADSRFLEDNDIRTRTTGVYLYGDEPFGSPLIPFLSFLGNSYVTSGLPGIASTSQITRQVDGYGEAGLRYRPPGTDLDFSAAGGIAQESQSSLSALGIIARAIAHAPYEVVNDNTLLSASLLADERFFNQRSERYSNDWASVSAASPIVGGTIDSNHAYFDARLERRDFFFSTDTGTSSTSPPIKQERTALSFSLRDSLMYPIVPNVLTSTVDAEFDPSSITRTSDISTSELLSNSFSSLSSLLVPNVVSALRLYLMGRLDLAASNTWAAQGRMSYEENSQDVSLLSNDLIGLDPATVSKFATTLQEASFSQRVTQADVSARVTPNPEDTLAGDFNANLLNYDTPSALNDDDHDILITSATAHYGHNFSSDLIGGIELRGARTHLVYLKSTRSAQNNVSQTIALSSYAAYAPAYFFAEVGGQVFADYTVLDYLDSVPALQGVGNYLLRGLTLTDSTSVPLGVHPLANAGPLTFEEGATVRISERGSYDVPTFSEVLDTRVIEFSATALLGLTKYDSYAPWTVRAGVQAFILSRSGPNTTIEIGQPFQELERQTRIGPLLTVTFLRPNGIGPMLDGSLWYAVIKDQTFDIPSITRTPQLESHLELQWMF